MVNHEDKLSTKILAFIAGIIVLNCWLVKQLFKKRDKKNE